MFIYVRIFNFVNALIEIVNLTPFFFLKVTYDYFLGNFFSKN